MTRIMDPNWLDQSSAPQDDIQHVGQASPVSCPCRWFAPKLQSMHEITDAIVMIDPLMVV